MSISRYSRRSMLLVGLIALAPAADVARIEVDGDVTASIDMDTRGVSHAVVSRVPHSVTATGKSDRLPQRSIAELKAGLALLEKGDVAEARAVRDAMPMSLDRRTLTWAIVLKGGGDLSSKEIAEAVQTLQHWPGAETLRKNNERALYRERPAPEVVVQAFTGNTPQTMQGVILLTRAHLALGDRKSALDVLVPFWRTEKLEAREESQILREFSEVLSSEDHRFRMERMLYAERVNSAQRVADSAGAKALADAWAAVIRGEKSAGKLLDAVPEAQRSAGWFFAKAKYLRKRGKYEDAAAVMLKAPQDPTAVVDPDAWWIERRVLSRELLDIRDVKTAYKIAAGHAAESPTNAADAEFHAGWYALRGLSEPKKSAEHFARIAEVAEGPISMSRAYYWLGRAAEAGGPGSAKEYYEQAATYGTAFYGQLAAAKIGRSAIDVAHPEPSQADRRTFTARDPVMAIRRLEAAGHQDLADILYRGLARDLTSPGEIALLAAMAEERGDHNLALRVGKIALNRGMEIGALSHPVGAIPTDANISGSGKALAYAIARQESEFKTEAVSKAGALGLLQLMPNTAKSVAEKAGLAFSALKLTTDPGYNATLGATFLGEQLGNFDGSYVLTFAGYNAGPGRARQWMKRYGDPRGKDLETVVDWIERIPFTETRGYVQRVMENYEVYKMRLTGTFDIADDLVHGRIGLQ
jgi:soluble lytic murein transglycosylase